ncbi:hypothetical protein REPUB_Repub17cG0002600 [Reevesia pubescens]
MACQDNKNKRKIENHRGGSRSYDWRSSLSSVFVANLSKRVSKEALWEAFGMYGRVLDVYISRFDKEGKIRNVTFAFVRYKFDNEAEKVIEEGNNRKIDGRFIKVQKAEKGRNRNVVSSSGRTERKSEGVFRDGRSYKEALVGSKVTVNTGVEGPSVSPEVGKEVGEDDDHVNVEVQEVSYDFELLHEKMEWLHRSAVGRTTGSHNFLELQATLLKKVPLCSISPMGGVTIFLTFSTKSIMEESLKVHKDLFEVCFDLIEPWSPSSIQREIAFWVCLEEVPLQVWHEDFFRSLGDCWGTFLKVDNNTINRSRFDTARMLILVESKLCIPSSVLINIKGKSFKILISVEDFQGVSQSRNDDGTNDSKDYSNYSSQSCKVGGPRVNNGEGRRLIKCCNDDFYWVYRPEHLLIDKGEDLSEEEQKGGSFQSLSGSYNNWRHALSVVPFNRIENEDVLGEENEDLEIVEKLEGSVVTETELFDGNSFNKERASSSQNKEPSSVWPMGQKLQSSIPLNPSLVGPDVEVPTLHGPVLFGLTGEVNSEVGCEPSSSKEDQAVGVAKKVYRRKKETTRWGEERIPESRIED